ncbi:hypothetical protein KSC_093720 [Ktedonobacter sp. SOSP1-52]|nr:hypothetical protein KSC_093720 [Ktedonobacter sp. SOSP1-52]
MDLRFASSAAPLLGLTDSEGAYFDPLFVEQRDHGSIGAEDTALRR